MELTVEMETKDLAIRRLSYSSLLTLHRCPKLFCLERHDFGEREESVHLAYGKAFGTGIQEVMKGSSLQQAWLAAFLAWDIGTEEEMDKDKKSLWFALLMVSKFAEEYWPMFASQGWKLLAVNGKSSDEYGYKLHFLDGFYMIGFIDAILYNELTGEIKVLEIKTTKYNNPSEALYANSWQAIGYGIILDKLAVLLADLDITNYSSYEVLYMVLKSNSMEIELMPFKKTKVQKAIWLKDITLDIERIGSYEASGHWPKYGESCFNYASYKPCKFFGVCHMSLKGIFLKDIAALNETVLAKEAKEAEGGTISMEVSLDEIINNQLEGA
jgi:hypothetical protein